MPSWVRYSVAVYLGLLLAGSLFVGDPAASAGPEAVPNPRRSNQPVWDVQQSIHGGRLRDWPELPRPATPRDRDPKRILPQEDPLHR